MPFIYGTGDDKLGACYRILGLPLPQLPKKKFNFERDSDGHLISYHGPGRDWGVFSKAGVNSTQQKALEAEGIRVDDGATLDDLEESMRRRGIL